MIMNSNNLEKLTTPLNTSEFHIVHDSTLSFTSLTIKLIHLIQVVEIVDNKYTYISQTLQFCLKCVN